MQLKTLKILFSAFQLFAAASISFAILVFLVFVINIHIYADY